MAVKRDGIENVSSVPNVMRLKKLVNRSYGTEIKENPYVKKYENILSDIRNVPQTTSVVQKPAMPGVNSSGGIVDSAKKYVGTPYVWGGESMAEGGMDCSGFVYNALRDAGYDIGRTTAQGYRSYGTQVDKSNLREGDLIFFGKDKATHIGIYIGNGQMIHSSGGSKNTKNNPGKGVSIASIDYRNDFLEARRV